MWIVFAAGSAFFAGITAVLAKIGIKHTDSNLATALRTSVVVVFAWLLVFLIGSQSGLTRLSLKSLVFLGLSGLATGASWLCYFRALQLGDINKVVPIDKSSTIMTMLMAMIFLREGITGLKALCLVFIGLGTYLMIERRRPAAASPSGSAVPAPIASAAPAAAGRFRWLPYAFGSALFASLTAILGKIGITDVESNLGTAIRTVVVLLMAWLIVLWQKKGREIKQIDKTSWLFIVLSGLATGLSWLCYYRALQTGPASVVVPLDKLSILVTVACGYLVFKEKLTAKAAVGLALIVAGTLLLVVTV